MNTSNAQIFEVLQMANLPRSDMPGYHQWLDVFHHEKWVGGWSFVPRDGKPEIDGLEFVVQRRFVAGVTATHAAMRFIEWLHNGNDESFLTAIAANN